MPFRDEQILPPASLITEAFTLRPITAADADLDYAAVMESKDYLRLWEQSSWPEDDFTVDANREDLEKLERWHANRDAFTYTVMDPTETTCLGCVYIFPGDASFLANAQITPVAEGAWQDYDAAVYFWARASQLAAGTDRTLLEALRTWFAQEWNLRAYLFVTSELFAHQVHLIESTDLTLRFHIAEPDKAGRYLAYA